MKHLLGYLLIHMVAWDGHTAPLQHSSEYLTRLQREVPETSYALPPDLVFKLDAPSPQGPGAILNQTEQSSYDGNFSYSFNADNGISVEVKGFQRTVGQETAQVMEGQYSYTAPDGTPVSVRWYADETGFHATTLNQVT